MLVNRETIKNIKLAQLAIRPKYYLFVKKIANSGWAHPPNRLYPENINGI